MSKTIEIVEQNHDDFEQKEQDILESIVKESPEEILHRIDDALKNTFILQEGMKNIGTRNTELGSVLLLGIEILRDTLIHTSEWLHENCIEGGHEEDEEEEIRDSIDKKIEL